MQSPADRPQELTYFAQAKLQLTPMQVNGFQDYCRNQGLAHPTSPEYMSGWTIGWGFIDGELEQLCIFPTDLEYKAGYDLGRLYRSGINKKSV